MSHFLVIKKQSRVAKDGKPRAQAFSIKKNRKFGDVIEQRGIKTKENVLIVGEHASGKSYWIERLYKSSKEIWAAKSENESLFLSALRPQSAWSDIKALDLWWAGRENPDDDRAWTKLKPYERLDFLPVYLKETKAVLFVDDAHKLSGRKLKIVQDCIRAADVWVVTATDEGRVSPGLRKDILYSNPQVFRLGTEVAYDATSIIMWVFILMALGLGAYEIAMALGGLKLLGSGQRASKQN